jgi:hypothetical protein
MAERSKAWNIPDHSNTLIVGSTPTPGMNVCFHSLFVFYYVGSGLATGWSPVQGVLPTVYKIQVSELISSELAQVRYFNPSRQKKKFQSAIISVFW